MISSKFSLIFSFSILLNPTILCKFSVSAALIFYHHDLYKLGIHIHTPEINQVLLHADFMHTLHLDFFPFCIFFSFSQICFTKCRNLVYIPIFIPKSIMFFTYGDFSNPFNLPYFAAYKTHCFSLKKVLQKSPCI